MGLGSVYMDINNVRVESILVMMIRMQMLSFYAVSYSQSVLHLLYGI